MSNLLGSKDIQVGGLFEQYINLEGSMNTSSLVGSIDQMISGSVHVQLSGEEGLNVVLVGSSFYVNLVGSISSRLSGAIRASSTLILASDGVARASSG